jgi:hypothetical protein
MRKTYIATTQEAKALFDGTQTAIITKMLVQPNKVDWNPIVVGKNKGWCDEHGRAIPVPYAIGQEVVVREKWSQTYDDINDKWEFWYADNPHPHWRLKSPATMPVSAARTRFIPVSCEAVRVRDMIFSQRHFLNVTKQGEHEAYIKSKLGQSAWDNNDYVFYYKIEKI